MNNKVKEKIKLNSPTFSLKNKLSRILWSITYYIFFRYSPSFLFGWRRLLLKLFGAKIGRKVIVYSSVKIWLPSNLILHAGATLGRGVNIYNQGRVEIGENSIVSQGTHICASTHDYNNPLHPLLLAPVVIGKNAWLCADSFVGPDVQIGEGTVIGARAVIMKSTLPWGVYAGNPALKIKQRKEF